MKKILFIILTVISYLPLMSIAQEEVLSVSIAEHKECRYKNKFLCSQAFKAVESSCAKWHYEYEQAKEEEKLHLVPPKSVNCVISDLISKNFKYIGKYNYTNKAINTTNVKLDENDELILNQQMQAETAVVDTDNSANLFSIGIEYGITMKGIVGAFNQEIAVNPNYYLFKFISLDGLKFSTSYQYTNTGTDKNLDNISFDVKTEKEFKYIVGLSYTGCISDILRGRLGCHDYEAEIKEKKKDFLKKYPPPNKNKEQDNKIATLEVKIRELEGRNN